MATGDIKNNLKKLHSELKKIKLPENMLNLKGLASGEVTAYLGIYDYLFQWYSPSLSKKINDMNLKLPSVDPSDPTKFLEGMYLVLRDMFSWKPPLTVVQLKSPGFVERKVIMCNEIIKLVTSFRCGPPPKSASADQSHLAHSGIKMIKKSANTINTLVKETPAPQRRERNSTVDNCKSSDQVRAQRSPSEGLLLVSKKKTETSKLYQTDALKKESERGQMKGAMKAVENTVVESLSKLEEIMHSFEERLSRIEEIVLATNPVADARKEVRECNDINSNEVPNKFNIEQIPLDKEMDTYVSHEYTDIQSIKNGSSFEMNGEKLYEDKTSRNFVENAEQL